MRSYENSGYNPYNDNYRLEIRGSARNYYSDNFYEDKEAQRQFLLDVLAVLRYICGEW